MRLFIATLSTETNTFCSLPTAMSGFEEFYLRHGNATQDVPNLMTEALHLWRSRAEALGWEVIESLSAIAEPAGPTVRSCYEALSGEILADLEAAGGADIILLQLHGAMVAEHLEDCEGDLLERIRARCPEATLGALLDLHCHLTDKMLTASDLLVCFKEYPHDDATARADEVFDLAVRTRAENIRPRMAMFDCRMINLYLTKSGAMKDFVARLSAAEKLDGVLSVSLSHAFPWGDVSDVGARTLVVTDRDEALARSMAEQLGREFYDLREQVTIPYLSMAEAIERTETTASQLTVLADMGDNTGGGSPGDTTALLQALLEGGIRNFACGIIWDPGAVRICCDAGVGSRLKLRIGGKASSVSGFPIDIEARIMNIQSDLGQHIGPSLEPLGTLVWLRLDDDVDILINNLRTQVYHPEAFEQIGVRLADKKAVALKSMFHFYSAFSEVSDHILQVATPGGTSPDFEKIALTKIKTPFWPQVPSPFGPHRDA